MVVVFTVSTAVCRGVKHLDISISPEQFTSPGIMFTCRSLTSLKLDFTCSVLDVPRGVPFPNLKTLHLKSVEFLSDDTTKSLLSSCNNLEDLVIAHCNIENLFNFTVSHHLLKRLTILSTFNSHDCRLMLDTPNLTYFKYASHRTTVPPPYHWPVMPKTGPFGPLSKPPSKAKDLIPRLKRRREHSPPPLFDTDGCNEKALRRRTYGVQLLLSCEPLSVFATLVELKICDYYREQSSCEYADLLINVKWSSSMEKGLEILLSSSPELEKLACHQEVLSKLPEKVAYCLLSKLKVMEILGFRNDKDVIEKAKYILKNGGALQKLTIRTLSNISKAKKLKMSEVLLGSPRESKHCCILIV
ncbi:F-box/LRR-repeat protein [Gossypium australe]|uniref:F-box/LRR-repeat protein n=1 Tax=Gossypium australe TaxID=47621 RepID=A0A5B6VG86_9ROSI|nr:F-box/LRR-repeat protein [Gossypium australe]